MWMDILVDQTPVTPDKHPGHCCVLSSKELQKQMGSAGFEPTTSAIPKASFSKLEL
jgi:hypothetical protein